MAATTPEIPFGELNMRDPVHVAWVKLQRNSELWHAAAIAVLNYLGDPRGFLPWLFEQPETDRASAGYIFFGGWGRNYLQGQTEFGGEGLSDEEWVCAMEAICRRASGEGFENDLLGLHPGFEAEQQACRKLVASGAIVDGIPVPRAILDKPFPPERKLAYFIEDGAILDYDPNAF